jgi:hypothetical protein
MRDRFGDQLAGAGTDQADAEQALGLRVQNQLRQTVGAIERRSPGPTRPGEFRRHAAPPSAACASVRLHHAISGSVKTTAGIARGANATFARHHLDRDPPFVRRLVREHRFAYDVPDREDRRLVRAALLVDHDEAALIDLRASAPAPEFELGRRPTATSTRSNSCSFGSTFLEGRGRPSPRA